MYTKKLLKRETCKTNCRFLKCEFNLIFFFVNSIGNFVSNMFLPDLNMDDDKVMHSYKSAYFGWIV